jgi:proline dehydrogenase
MMCLAEALLRIPDAETANQLIRDKLREADFGQHLGESDSLFVNASTWALMLTGRILKLDEGGTDLAGILKRLVTRSGEPVIRQAVTQAMKILGRQFVMGRTIDEALDRAEATEAKGYRYSYDMLGEAARTAADAKRYFDAYEKAISAIGKASAGKGPIKGPGISIKLSALHPRYEFAQKHRVMTELVPRIVSLAQAAKRFDIGFTIDAEEADRLDLSLDVIEAVSADPSLTGWNGFGLAIQGYQKRCSALIDCLAEMARHHKRRLMVRLVKGAYWDSEIKNSQERGLAGYPVFTRKATTDVSYLACAKKLLADPEAFFPQFATHNAHSLIALRHVERAEHPIPEGEDETHVAVQMARFAAVMHLMHPGADEDLTEHRAVAQRHMGMPEVEADHIEGELDRIDAEDGEARSAAIGEIAEDAEQQSGEERRHVHVEDDFDGMHAIGGDRRHDLGRMMHLVKFPERRDLVEHVVHVEEQEVSEHDLAHHREPQHPGHAGIPGIGERPKQAVERGFGEVGHRRHEDQSDRHHEREDDAVDQEELVIGDRRFMEIDLLREEIGEEAPRRALGAVAPEIGMHRNGEDQRRKQIAPIDPLVDIDRIAEGLAQRVPDCLPDAVQNRLEAPEARPL